jgi:hypothetical protein
MKGHHRQGGKYCGTHTSLLEPAERTCDFLEALKEVERISLGIIQMPHSRSRSGQMAVKILDERGCVLVKVLQHSSSQEIRVYMTQGAEQSVKLALAKFVRNNRWELRFGNHA